MDSVLELRKTVGGEVKVLLHGQISSESCSVKFLLHFATVFMWRYQKYSVYFRRIKTSQTGTQHSAALTHNFHIRLRKMGRFSAYLSFLSPFVLVFQRQTKRSRRFERAQGRVTRIRQCRSGALTSAARLGYQLDDRCPTQKLRKACFICTKLED